MSEAVSPSPSEGAGERAMPEAANDPRAIRPVHLLLLAGIVLMGFYFRFAGLNWDEGLHLHPDERFLTQVLTAVEIPKSLGDYFNSAESPLNPRNRGYTFFVYGDFPIILTRFVAGGLTDLCLPDSDAPIDATTGRPAPTAFDSFMRGLGFTAFCYHADGSPRPMTGYDEVALVGRVVSALFDLGTLLWLFLVAREVYGTRAGLLSMALGSLAVLQIQQAHFFTADTFATFFVTAAFYFIVRAGRTGELKYFIAAGFGVGLAMASRINVAPLLGILALAAFGRAIHDRTESSTSARIETALLQVIVGVFAAFIAFRIFMPNAFSGLLKTDERWGENMSTISQVVSGDITAPWDIQWTDRKALIFPWVNMVFWGLGVPLGIAAWLSWAFATWKLLGQTYRAHARHSIVDWLRGVVASKHLLIWVWVTAYFVWQGSQWVKSMRYLLPIYPFMAMLAGWGLISAWNWARKKSASAPFASLQGSSRDASYKVRLGQIGAYALPVVVFVGTFLWAIGFTEIYRQPSTRAVASRWVYENVSSAATLHYDDVSGARNVQLELPSTAAFSVGVRQIVAFQPLTDGTLTGLTFNRASDTGLGDVTDAGARANVIQIKIALDPEATQVIAEGQIETPRGAPEASYSMTFDGGALEAGRTYFFVGEALEGTFIARSSVLLNEHFDDGVPMRMDGKDGFSFYRGLEMPNYDEDDAEKPGKIIGRLTEADYIFLTSNRLYASIPRQPLRYPLASEYYRLLFTGQLGFDLLAEFSSYERIGPFEFPDQETTQALGLWPDPTRLVKPGVMSVPYPPAEEAFSVYDHPRVLVFKKRVDFNIAEIIPKLSGFDLETVYHGFTPKSETLSPTGQMLTPDAQAAQQDAGTWSEIFDRNSILNTTPGLGAIVWYVAVAVLGWIVFPILYVAVPGLADRGYGMARTLGVLLLSFVIWFAASVRVLPFTREAIFLVALVLLVCGALIARSRRAELRDFFRRNRRLILIEEGVFAAAFLLFLALRFGNPDLWHPWKGGEKPMDFAYFNAVIKSQYFPPYDPWFSGGFMTYYYYGFMMVATLTKLLGVIPSIAYNLCVPTIYALGAMTTFSVAHGLAARFGARRNRPATSDSPQHNSGLAIRAGLIAVVFVMLIGNLGEVKLLVDAVAKVGEDAETSILLPGIGEVVICQPLNTTIPALKTTHDFICGALLLLEGRAQLSIPTDQWYWNPTRIIPAAEGEAGPITEIPFFTFLYADLHAHMMALPLTILMLGLATSWVMKLPLKGRHPALEDPRSETKGTVADVLSLVLGGLTLGALKAANSADYPTYLAIGAIALAFGTWASEPLRETETWLRFAMRIGLFFVSAQILFLPFASSDRLGTTTIDLWQGSRTVLWAYLFIHGIFLLPIATYLFVELRHWSARWAGAVWKRLADWRWLIGLPLTAVALLMLGLVLTGVSVLLIAGPFILVLLVLMLRPSLHAATRFWMLLAMLALALSVAVEVVVFRGDISRMNMVFKFYYQIWVLLGIAGGVALAWLWERASLSMPRLNGGWRTTVVLLVIGGLLYPPFAARGKLAERFNEGDPPGLDGMAYMEHAVYTEVDNNDVLHEWQLKWDYEALIWMQDNIAGTPVVAEGRSRHEYLWGSRVSIYTGLPMLFGWNNHQRQQRGLVVPGSILDQRAQDVSLLYNDPTLVTTRKIIRRYNVKYIYVGQLERSYYADVSLSKFDQMTQAGELRIVYQNPGTTIYEVVTLSP